MKVLDGHFELIYWDGMGKVMNEFPKTFQDWVTRHISDFNGCHRYLSRYTDVENKCPVCGAENEDTSHITRCPDPTRTALYNEDVSTVKTWLLNNHTPTKLANLISNYLLQRGSILMSSLISPSSQYSSFADTQDCLGFDNLLVGRIPKSLVAIMTPIIYNLKRRGVNPDLWARQLARELILFTHKQWIYRNTVKHFKPSEGKTTNEHQQIDIQVRSLLSLNPSQLLPHHRYLLTSHDYTFHCSTSSTAKQFWIADVQAALNEAALIHQLKKEVLLFTYTYIYHT
jgi:hypothetical protein